MTTQTPTGIKSYIAICLLILTSSFSGIFAQEASWPSADIDKALKMGKLPPKWLHYDVFEPDTTAAALILADLGYSEMVISENVTFTLFTIQRRFKVLSEAGVQAGDIKVYYSTDGGNVSNIEGYTYNLLEDGEVEKIKLSKKDIYGEDVSKTTKMKKWAMPKLKKGSVFEYTYTIRIPGVRIVDWVFQDRYPVLLSRYELSHPELMILAFVGRGDLTHLQTNTERYDASIMLSRGQRSSLPALRKTYSLKNILPLKEEPYTTAMSDYQASIKFILQAYRWPSGKYESALPTWEELTDQLLKDEDFGKALKENNKYESWLEEQELDEKEVGLEQAMEVYAAVQESFEWDERYRQYMTRNFSDIMENRKASSGAINLIMTGIFRQLGYEAHPVILSTRSNGAIFSAYPLFNQFNHTLCLVKVGDQFITLDASDKYCLFGMLPTPSLNGEAFLLTEKNPQWIALSPNFPQIESTIANGSMATDGMLEISINTKFKSSEACRMRESFATKSSKDEEFAKRMLFGEKGDEITLDELTFDHEDQEKPFQVECKLNTNTYADVIGEFVYLQPMLGRGFDENPFKLKERTYPVDFARPMQWEYSLNFKIPDGYQVESVPKPVRFALPEKGGSFLFQTQQAGPFLQLKSVVIIKQTKFSPKEYLSIKAFFDYVTAKHGEQIVLKKTTK